ncbi:leucine-rich repeat receptor-like protein kinase PXC2 [Andrographis paniculata]|uniref:leucine-rich repeat receptor-like protein kinase PXC2 n=1 Tax=Andrographis paniculata TaxID=175694 RepID=UPI0021E803AC|nr:leucine-rich repeat receptor-like protein kinase PXC2 [Andrographis paniculata]XP_051131041.1 leucine-rich repeat receptor-like protein kinase PXC2 [Andrographis paniculata]XP_051131042.1 leucine-rich repeat receptor-like protein kinase PXC2 [Andrographis paniculata]
MLAALFLLLLPSFLLVHSLETTTTAFNDDVLGLIVFKAGLSDPHSRLASWSEEDNSACGWVGVVCDPATNRVSHLLLDGFSLSGHIGRSLVRLQFLRVLQLSRNNFSGVITPPLFQIPSLQMIDLSENNLSGLIPAELFQRCAPLKAISLANNLLTGPIPQSLSSCANLESLNFSSNRLSGRLTSGLWSPMTSLQLLDLSDNMLAGEIPREIESLSSLRVINLSRNSLSGWLPEGIGNCLLLESINFGENYLLGGLPPSMRKLGSCRYLDVSGNLLTGAFPDWIGEMRSLELIDVSDNNLSGRIPSSVANLQSLKQVNLSNNQFVGSLPDAFGGCGNLKVLDIGHNWFSGNVPWWIFKLSLESLSVAANRYSGSISVPASPVQSHATLRLLDLSSNALTGDIPPAIGNFRVLQALNLSRNSLVGSIPAGVAGLNTTCILDMSHNLLSGNIPAEIGRALSLRELRLESNLLAGAIPPAIGNCSALTFLFLGRNNLTGPLPVKIASIANLEHVDLSFNNLSGRLPKELGNLSHLATFNVSFNHLQGELPVGGFFNAIPPSSVIGNPSLCGSLVNHTCPAVHPKPLVLNPNSSASNHGPLSPNLRHKRIVLSISSIVAIAAAMSIALGVVAISILNMHARSSTAARAAAFPVFSGGGGDDNFSPSCSHDAEANYGKLVMFTGEAEFVAGAQGLLNKDCELGRGGFGVVYRTVVQGGGRSVVIKKLHSTSLVKCGEAFEKEVRALGRIRHPNLVVLEGYYWTPSLQLLINEYIAGGSLYKHLHDKECGGLTWQERFKIVVGTAKGLACLHGQSVIHYNIKSSNVLIDERSGEPKLGDFGLARGLGLDGDRCILSSKVQSALGYMAPELACQTVKITEKCDVYGFGVLILEVVTGKRPVEYMEDDVVVVCDTVREALEEGRLEGCVDEELKGMCPMEEAVPMVKLGLVCASQVPSSRPDMEEVVRILELIRCPPAPAERQRQGREEAAAAAAAVPRMDE